MIFLLAHLGLGDCLILNGLVRNLVTRDGVVVPAKPHNVDTVKFMFRDLPTVTVMQVADDIEMLAVAKRFRGGVVRTGMFGANFSFKDWDLNFYKQAGVAFSERWDRFEVQRAREREVMLWQPFIFLHHDSERGFAIPKERWPNVKDVRVIQPWRTTTLFDWMRVLEEAEEIHCIDSSFAILADSIPTTAKRLVLHLYSRPGAKPPTYKKDWQILVT